MSERDRFALYALRLLASHRPWLPAPLLLLLLLLLLPLLPPLLLLLIYRVPSVRQTRRANT
ncbi:hypothetical protein [Xanthomonas translucens]|uniref:hypothetical protein n=1 Tax=Xanthomonas campestris pv. translucens TaxID=343 RepID=UPI000A4CFE04|nr:hypothetical protein [Xanthomonas translucens]MCT8272646.1 hypothetical protein [Xanthomonas translucens pv. undulosa]QSQ52307.1 hypothetical protein ISN36_16735 [Xanthomonas translucens pv. undulosa]UJB14996.1 hypothetical protein LTC53_19095 [Xanthomonas translucens pv. undulosa]UKE39669.1 hypothetical protein KCU58_19030 [Xanthomonas translucens pv. undulosa]WLA04651.1 hypothetical protein MO329_19110 [Xanthomonas translucens]